MESSTYNGIIIAGKFLVLIFSFFNRKILSYSHIDKKFFLV